MGVDMSAMTDLILDTLKDLPKDQVEVMWDSHNYEFCRIYQEHRRQIDGGTSIKRNVMLDRNGRARYRRLYDTDQPTVDNNQQEIDVPFCQIGTDYSWDVVEVLANKNSEKGFINLIEARKLERMWDLAELIEDRGWLTPTSATDKLYPYGVPYYINYTDNSATTGGFVGKTIRYTGGTTGTICAGIDANLEPKWRNYADLYTKVDNSLLRRLRSAVRRTRFRPAPMVKSMGKDGVGSPIKMYANDDVVTELEDLADKRDDATAPQDLAGKMLHSFDGTVNFNRIPIQYVDQLDGVTVTDSTAASFAPDPIYCIDWSKFQPVVRDGYWQVESKPYNDRGQHTTITVYNDGSHNNLVNNRRTAGFVLHKAIP